VLRLTEPKLPLDHVETKLTVAVRRQVKKIGASDLIGFSAVRRAVDAQAFGDRSGNSAAATRPQDHRPACRLVLGIASKQGKALFLMPRNVDADGPYGERRNLAGRMSQH
jgi:hypothetical protein